MSSSGWRDTTIAVHGRGVGERDLDRRGVGHDVQRGEDRALVVDDHAGPDRVALARCGWLRQDGLDEDDRGLDRGIDELAASGGGVCEARTLVTTSRTSEVVSGAGGGRRRPRARSRGRWRSRRRRTEPFGGRRTALDRSARPLPGRRMRLRVHLAGHPGAGLPVGSPRERSAPADGTSGSSPALREGPRRPDHGRDVRPEASAVGQVYTGFVRWRQTGFGRSDATARGDRGRTRRGRIGTPTIGPAAAGRTGR